MSSSDDENTGRTVRIGPELEVGRFKATAEFRASVKATGIIVTVEDNPVAGYAFFAKQYNEPCNIVEGKKYEVPDCTSCEYKIYKALFWYFCRGCFCCHGLIKFWSIVGSIIHLNILVR